MHEFENKAKNAPPTTLEARLIGSKFYFYDAYDLKKKNIAATIARGKTDFSDNKKTPEKRLSIKRFLMKVDKNSKQNCNGSF